MRHLRDTAPDALMPLVDYFDATYVSGTVRTVRWLPTDNADVVPSVLLRCSHPLFPPETWNVYESTLGHQDRTNNLWEAWNASFEQLVGHKHPSVWTVIEHLRTEDVKVDNIIEQDALGQPPTKRVNGVTRDLQQRLLHLCAAYRDGQKTVVDLLQRWTHCLI